MLKAKELTTYARLLVQLGVNLQPGQNLAIRASTDAAPLVHKLVEVAYESGAPHVLVDWSDDEINRIRLRMAPEEMLAYVPEGKVEDFIRMIEGGAAVISILTPKPELLKDVETSRIATVTKAMGKAMKKYQELAQGGEISWTIGVVPTAEWANVVFPELEEEAALAKLWESIKLATRLDHGDPLAYWQAYANRLEERTAWLNDQQFTRLQYRGPGTELTVELPKNHRWLGGGLKNSQGVYFLPNIPTEEVFTAPVRNGVNGRVRNSKPLVYNGQVIDGFTLTFENGRVVQAEAETGNASLQALLQMDAGAAHLGEVALVPHDSVLSKLGVVFRNTLFDENASCHFALGAAYPFCIEDGVTMSKEERAGNGLNESVIHVDFMVGTAELDIDAVTVEGRVVPLFRNGNWV
ncbi:peptidase M29 [Thermoactinomyces vulgaris]|jgi:aminopeptidase|nr:peptidase M29 [Thermoactinomyces vulgaris]